MPEINGRFEITDSFVDVDLGNAKDFSALIPPKTDSLPATAPHFPHPAQQIQQQIDRQASQPSFAIRITNERNQTRNYNPNNPSDAGRKLAELHQTRPLNIRYGDPHRGR